MYIVRRNKLYFLSTRRGLGVRGILSFCESIRAFGHWEV